MTTNIRVEEVSPRPLAIARGRTSASTIPARIRELFPVVYAFLKEEGLLPAGLNVVVYPEGMGPGCDYALHAGVETGAEFEEGRGVVRGATPGGRVAAALHRGSYDTLGETYHALKKWCEEQGLTLAGPFWEVYGHWNDDPALLETEIFYLLA